MLVAVSGAGGYAAPHPTPTPQPTTAEMVAIERLNASVERSGHHVGRPVNAAVQRVDAVTFDLALDGETIHAVVVFDPDGNIADTYQR
ncbi:MAG: hypothetical protein KGJ86_00160 [Chloroflexota bacterium]|nr:hypothetical protein [Chloroflexota bacterium]